MKIEEERYKALKKFIGQKGSELELAEKFINDITAQNGEDKEYIASMLLRYAVLDGNQEIEKLLLKCGGDPRKQDATSHESAVTNALDMKDFDSVKIFSKYGTSNTKMPLDDYTIGNIYGHITGEHDYSTEDLLITLGNLYTNVEEIFN